MAAKRTHKSRSMSLASAKSLAKAFNGTRFLISGDRQDKRAWNASRSEVRASIPACYHEVFDAGCPAFGAAVREGFGADIPARAPAPAQAEPERVEPNRYGTARERGAWSYINDVPRSANPHGTGASRCAREWFTGYDIAMDREHAAR